MQTQHGTSDLLRLTEVAAFTRVPLSTVRAWVAGKKLRSLKVGRWRVVRQADLEKFLSDCER